MRASHVSCPKCRQLVPSKGASFEQNGHQMATSATSRLDMTASLYNQPLTLISVEFTDIPMKSQTFTQKIKRKQFIKTRYHGTSPCQPKY